MVENIKITIHLFGAFRQYSDEESIQFELPVNTSLSELKNALAERFSDKAVGFDLAGLMASCAFADQQTILQSNITLTKDSVLAVIPPVCGG